jgi:serine/threonine protein kinase
LGILLFTLVAGEKPWSVSNISLMLRQILKASYTIPLDVSAGCRDLIQQILRVNPEQRIAIQDVLAHPWMERAGPLLRQHRIPSPLPPMHQAVSLKIISDGSARSSRPSEEVVFSPFGTCDEPKMAGQLAPMKCRSAENVSRWDVEGSRKAVTKGVQPILIAGAHQSSLVTLVPIGIKARKRSFGQRPAHLLASVREEG